jgi:hypothetical protein
MKLPVVQTVADDRILINNEFKKIWKEAAVV